MMILFLTIFEMEQTTSQMEMLLIFVSHPSVTNPFHFFYGKMMNNQWILGGGLIFREAHRVYEKLLLGGLSSVYQIYYSSSLTFEMMIPTMISTVNPLFQGG